MVDQQIEVLVHPYMQQEAVVELELLEQQDHLVQVDPAVEDLVQDQLILQEDQERQILVVAVELEKIQEDHQDQVVQEL